MPVAARAIKSVRGQKTIGLPCSQEQSEPIVDDPEQFRTYLDQQIQAMPELVPPEIQRGERRKDVDHSRKTGWKLRRIELRTLQSFLVRPSVWMPSLSGHTEDVQSPLFSARAPFLMGR
jgi:hypothetical protein